MPRHNRHTAAMSFTVSIETQVWHSHLLNTLEDFNEAGATVVSSCAEGTCGTCETRVLDGVPDHRDSVLDAAERSRNDCMMICVSRSCTASLRLDL